MNKYLSLITLIMAFMLVMNVGLATISPAPIGGIVNTLTDGVSSPAVNQMVVLTNSRTMESITVYTSNDGEFLVDWANTIQKYQSGDIVSISVMGVMRQVILPDVDLVLIDISSVCPTPVCPIIPCETCPICPDCPTCPEPVKCDSCCPICPIPTSPQFDWTLFLGGGITVLVVFLGSAAVFFRAKRGRLQVYKKYKKADGTYAYKWITVTEAKWKHLTEDEVF